MVALVVVTVVIVTVLLVELVIVTWFGFGFKAQDAPKLLMFSSGRLRHRRSNIVPILAATTSFFQNPYRKPYGIRNSSG